MTNVLIIGGSGCVGQETSKWLLDQKVNKVVGLSRGKTSFNSIDGVTYEQGDILEVDSISRVLEKHQITHILHTAALRTSDCKLNPAAAVKININGTCNILEAVRLYGKIQRLVFTSTAAVYEVPANGDFPDETFPVAPINAYTATKIACENMIECYSQNYQIPATILRPQIIYGPSRGSEGSTAGVSTALKEAAAGRSYTIPFNGQIGFHYSGDIGLFHGKALLESPHFFKIYNLPGESLIIKDLVQEINNRCQEELIDYKSVIYPFPLGLNDKQFHNDFSNCQPTLFKDALDQVFA